MIKQNYPIKRNISIKTEITFWDCGRPFHRHRTEKAALHCKARLPKIPSQPPNTIYCSQNIAMARAIINGASFKIIGKQHKMSWNQVRKIFYGLHFEISRLRLMDDHYPGKKFSLPEIRKYKTYWLRAINRLSKFEKGEGQNNHES